MMWEEQWKLFAPNFYDGKAHIETPAGVVRLYPGPGFGDFSHPTTRLTMELMQDFVHGRHVVDIGCGSGILSFAAARMGAQSVYGYDIDREAIEHAQKNCRLNPGLIEFSLSPPKTLHDDTLFLMNMISTEQKKAWTFKGATVITSGVLQQDQAAYLEWTSSQGWRLHSSLAQDGWCGFVFTSSHQD